MRILLKEINKDNWYQCVGLKVAENQKNFVASNAFSLAQSKYEDNCIPLGIYDEDTMIAFVMLAIDKDQIESGKLWICRFMVDEKFQGKGCGKTSMAKIIEYAKNEFSYDEIYLSEVPENKRAKGLYESFGFKYTGEVDEDGEEVMVLALK